MQVILSKDIEKLGKAGAVVKVKDGFARNFLIPNNLALPFNSANIKKLEETRQREMIKLAKAKKEAEAIKEKLAGLSLTIPVLTQEDEKLYGSVGVADIADALKEEGFLLEREMIQLAEPIKSLGIYEVAVKLHPQVSGTLKIWIVKK